MTFTESTFAVDGASIDGRLYRLQLAAATYEQTGIIKPTDLEVRELATPGTSVRILAGACVIAGDAVVFQGSYFGFNVGQEEVPIAAADATGPRSDMIIVQAHDPNYSGSEFTEDPATDRIVYPEVVPDVSPTATTTSEVNAIPLARIDIPASTATITQNMITDLRRPLILSPYFQDSVNPIGSGGDRVDFGLSDTFVTPPGGSTTVNVPTWATRMDIAVDFNAMIVNAGGGGYPNNMWGQTRIRANSSVLGTGGGGNWNRDWNGGSETQDLHDAGTYNAVPYRGTSVHLEFQMNVVGKSGNEKVQAGPGTQVVWQVFFRQEPEYNF